MVPDLLVLLLVPDGVAQVILRHLGEVSTLQELESTTTRRSGERGTNASRLEGCCNQQRPHRSAGIARAGDSRSRVTRTPSRHLHMRQHPAPRPPLFLFCAPGSPPPHWKLVFEPPLLSQICQFGFPYRSVSDAHIRVACTSRVLRPSMLASPAHSISSCAKHGTQVMIKLHRPCR